MDDVDCLRQLEQLSEGITGSIATSLAPGTLLDGLWPHDYLQHDGPESTLVTLLLSTQRSPVDLSEAQSH